MLDVAYAYLRIFLPAVSYLAGANRPQLVHKIKMPNSLLLFNAKCVLKVTWKTNAVWCL